jgi:tetratricopeptide (TPR) repeat protein
MTTATETAESFDLDFERLLDRGRQLLAQERLEEALCVYEEAEDLAQAHGNLRASDLAFVNRCAVLIPITRAEGLSGEVINRLREILMAGGEDVSCRLAAYNIARTFEFTKEHRKGLFYARIALDRSDVLGVPDWLASSHNQIGNFLLAESRFEEARDEYEKALALLPDGAESVRLAAIHDNLGYAYAMLGQARKGFTFLYRSLRSLRRLGARRERILPHLSLSFVLLETGRLGHALRHGLRALGLAEEAGENDSIKHALFLVGEAAHQAGDPDGARRYFERLQARYFPDADYLPDVLLTVDIRKLINLKA